MFKFSDFHIFCTARKVSKYGVISGSYFSVFSANTGKYGPEITPYLDTLHTVLVQLIPLINYIRKKIILEKLIFYFEAINIISISCVVRSYGSRNKIE